ncbi:Na+-transporting NADH:ubiquinone oxidoreductase subunit F [Alkalispirochaeta americana]|uniref:Na+-transporting NADH:ubiquinone oxidoreductase subunit F n=1 Tax=Alkalispirochaeta americana TaxID=159291 RepID=A0A1N6NY46_9SPIO|nr:2Fe-2S iron-sulfur cluster binding domain-containing protein [Alkalispirochaeta americana]SIP97009.1 Na+-transporting NADH:ubiquinone oxidoreductase subunit F [Alkalispirochaeta americana]
MNALFLTGPLAVGSIAAALAALIAITDKIVNNYGEITLDINGGRKQLSLKGGQPMLFGLAEEGIFVPSACGGRGSCGACKVVVHSDIGPVMPTEVPYLSKEELQQKVRLSCQIKLKQDVSIEIPEELFNVQDFSATVTSLKGVTHDIKEVLCTLPQGREVSFLSGQYGQFEVPPYGKVKERTMRAYSISSPPGNKTELEFLIRLVPGGIVTTYVHEHLKEGDTIRLVGPFGDFAVRQSGAAMICVAGGSGMAPFKSIFQDMIDKGTLQDREIWYFFGARSLRDLFYLEWLEELDRTCDTFHFIPALSEPQPEDDWKGATGLITDVLDRYLKEEISSDLPKEGYLCGSPGMLDACMAVMTDNSMNTEDIFFDKFA